MSTAFQLHQNGRNLICKNQDVIYDGVYVFTNQREVRKTALMMPPATPVTWVSVYGSITVSQIGKENPNGGMNEAGLVVEQTTLWQTQYPSADERPALNELQWIQYMLDTCQSVQEVLVAAAKIRIDQNTSKLHYLVSDRSGDYAIIEFLHGKMHIYRESDFYPVMTNSPYAPAIDDIKAGRNDWSGCDEYERNSLERLQVVMEKIDVKEEDCNPIVFAFEVLTAARRNDTVFSLVYDQEFLQIHATTNRNQANKTIPLADFDFSKESPALATDLQLLQPKSIRDQFEPFTTAFNYQVIHSFFRDPTLTSLFKWEITDEMLSFLAQYPESLVK